MAIFNKEFNVKNGLAVDGVVAIDADRDAFLKDVTYTGDLKIGTVVAPKTNATQAEMEEGTQTSNEFMSPANIKQAIDMLAPKRIGSLTRDMTGFEDRTTTNISYNAASRTFTLSPVGSSANIWYRGTKYTLTTSLTYVWADTPGGKYINLDPTTWTLYDGGATGGIENNLLVGYLYWDAINDVVIINGDERHGYQRDTTWHAAQHLNLGAVWRSGGNITVAKDSQTDLTIGLTTPITFADEDLVHTISHTSTPVGNFDQILNSQAQIPVLTYVNGQYLQQSANQVTTVPWLRNGTILQYNPINAGVGTVSDVTSGKYISYWLIATNDKVFPVKLVAGRAMFDTQDAANNESFEAYGLPFPELVPMYQIILHYNPTLYTTSVCRAVIKDTRILLDRRTTATSSFNASSHSGLTNLTTSDDHTQYVHTTTARDVTAAHKFLGLASVKTNFLGVGSGVTTPTTDGEIRASGSITAFYSDERLKTDVQVITDAINKVETLRGVTYQPNDFAISLGYKKENHVGLLAQDVQRVLPEAVKIAPFDADENGNSKSGENYLTVQYEKLIPLLVEAIKQLNKEVQELKGAK